MNKVKLPDRIFGQWIVAEAPSAVPGKMTWLRKTFFCDAPGEDAVLWITATGCFQIFINGRLSGFGPRPHTQKDALFIEEYDVNDFLEQGENVISVILIQTAGQRDPGIPPGLWCQAVSSRRELFGSDDSWLLRDGSLPEGNRARFTAEFAPLMPLEEEEGQTWKQMHFRPGDDWRAPERCLALEKLSCRFELHPLAPPVIGLERPSAELRSCGRLLEDPPFSGFCFRKLPDDDSVRAAVGWIFSDGNVQIPAVLHTDDPYRFFCNKVLLSSGSSAGGAGVTLPLQKGWNRLLFYQNPRRCGMGALLIFDRNVSVLQDMTPEAPAGWLLTGPLHVSLETAAPSLQLHSLPVEPYHSGKTAPAAPCELLRRARMEESASAPGRAGSGTFWVFDFGRLCYGFARIGIEAEAGDVVELLLGAACGPNKLPAGSAGERMGMSFSCRQGANVFQTPVPAEFRYAAVYVRRSRNACKIVDVSVDELQYDVPMEGAFRCSDGEFNRIWQEGSELLRRTSAYVPRRNGLLHNEFRLLDSYIDAANMAAVSGNAEYVALGLRQYLSMQREDGSIPMLTYGDRPREQLAHLFFLPVWIAGNYRFSANRVELERALTALNRLREYLDSLADEEGLLSALPARFHLHEPLLDALPPEGTSCALNALYCRFLLSAAEVYSLAGDETCARLCRTQARQVAAALRAEAADPETGLLLDRCRDATSARCELVSNFYGMYAGVTPIENFEKFFHRFFRYDPPGAFQKEAGSRHRRFLFLEMLFALRQRPWALKYLRSIEAEAAAGRGEFLTANVFLLREVLGIRIAEPGYSTVFFNPACREVRSAEGVVPMARGHLRVRWEAAEDGTLEVLLNSSCPVSVIPEMNRRQLAATSFRLGGEITLLQPPSEILDDEEF